MNRRCGPRRERAREGMGMRFGTIGVAVAWLAATGTWASAGIDPAVKCEGAKNAIAGAYAACLAKAHKGLATDGDAQKFADGVSRCDAKYSKKWQASEAKAGAGACPSEGDAAAVAVFVAACVDSVADAVGGAALPADALTCAADREACQTGLDSCMAGLDTCTSGLEDCGADEAVCATGVAACQSDTAVCNGALSVCEDALDVCDADLNACLAEPPSRPLVTSQTGCWNAAGAPVACDGTGQDGETQTGVARSFVDNGDGTITDVATGLMWEKHSDDGSVHDKDVGYTWYAAFGKISTLNATEFAGYDDWRLPNVNELVSLYDFTAVASPRAFAAFQTGCGAGCDGLSCSCTGSEFYWASTSSVYSPASASAVDFGSAWTHQSRGKTDAVPRVRAVRTAP